jgi:hypothetical protein
MYHPVGEKGYNRGDIEITVFDLEHMIPLLVGFLQQQHHYSCDDTIRHMIRNFDEEFRYKCA